MWASWGDIDYRAFLREAGCSDVDSLVLFLKVHLPYLCRDAYLASTLRPTDIVRFQHGTFEYVFDNYTMLEVKEVVPYSVLGGESARCSLRDLGAAEAAS